MHSRSVGFVGGGRITAIFLEALGGRGLALDRVTVSDTSTEVLSKLSARFPAITTTAVNGESAACERVFLALHPPALKAVLPEIAPRVRKDAFVVSLAPVLTLARLPQMLGGFARLARVLPNAPSFVRAPRTSCARVADRRRGNIAPCAGSAAVELGAANGAMPCRVPIVSIRPRPPGTSSRGA